MWSEWAIGRPIRKITRFIISGIALESQTIRVGDAGIISYYYMTVVTDLNFPRNDVYNCPL